MRNCGQLFTYLLILKSAICNPKSEIIKTLAFLNSLTCLARTLLTQNPLIFVPLVGGTGIVDFSGCVLFHQMLHQQIEAVGIHEIILFIFFECLPDLAVLLLWFAP